MSEKKRSFYGFIKAIFRTLVYLKKKEKMADKYLNWPITNGLAQNTNLLQEQRIGYSLKKLY